MTVMASQRAFIIEGSLADKRRAPRRGRLEEAAMLRAGGQTIAVLLQNLSADGAMITGQVALALRDQVEIRIGGCGWLNAVVRWRRGDRFGLQFANETRIDAGSAARTNAIVAAANQQVGEVDRSPSSEKARRSIGELRHALFWSGTLHFGSQASRVVLLNVSARGAMIKGASDLQVGQEVQLDLGQAGRLTAAVHWSHGQRAGLRFSERFEVRQILKSRPQVTEQRYEMPSQLRRGRIASYAAAARVYERQT